jgi:asparagine synthase (glutamine-hydrolysing)
MSSNLLVSIATNDRQLVGYWGWGNSEKLRQQLAPLGDRISTQNHWKISDYTSRDRALIALSAGGLPPEDLWVKIDENCLTLGRSAFGRMPLYWLQIDRVIWFGSQLQLLLPLVTNPQVNLAALYGYSCFSYVPTPLTPIERIRAVSAGTAEMWRGDRQGTLTHLSTQSMLEWSEKSTQIDDERSAVVQLQQLLTASIERQITDVDDRTVGVFLSGGLDSSIVAALLVRAGVKVRAYTLDFGNAGTPEYPYAEQVAAYLEIPLVKVDASPRQIQAALIPTIKALDLPFGDGVTVPLFLLNRAASQDTQIVFNGEGGDQLFAGWTNKPLIAASIYQSAHPDRHQSSLDRYLRTFHRLWGYEAQIFQPDVYAQIRSIHPQDWLKSALDETHAHSVIHRLRRASLMLKGAQNIQPRATNLAVAHGLQVRSPFCDLSLAQWTFQVSGSLYLQGSCEKYILKKAVEDWLPPAIVWREKRGMGVPLTSWCLNEWWYSIGQWLNPGILRSEGRWMPDLAATIAFGNLGGAIQGRRIGEILWLLIVWELWREHVLGESIDDRSWSHPFWLSHWIWRRLLNF